MQFASDSDCLSEQVIDGNMITISHAHGTVVGGLGIRSSGICLCPHLSLSQNFPNIYVISTRSRHSIAIPGLGFEAKERKKKSEWIFDIGGPVLLRGLSTSYAAFTICKIGKDLVFDESSKTFVVSSLSLSLSL